MRFLPLLAAASVIVLIAGCQSAPTSSAPGGPAAAPSQAAAQKPVNPATRAASAKAHLAIEKLRLAELFRGTPVLFVLQPDGSLRVDVPLNFSFDAGKAVVKPPLAAVLDRIAAGQLQEVTQVVIRAPADAGAQGAAMVAERAASIRNHFVAHGIADARIVSAGSSGAALVRIVVTDTVSP